MVEGKSGSLFCLIPLSQSRIAALFLPIVNNFSQKILFNRSKNTQTICG
ncbi:hypothetical protein THF1C08_260057 [Vibrio jasicida]|uniref:Uncharacterized protein n=1 Tax=Vibrio jasicida TaxID=766224 RepID=A0AAU9QS34_9VIBR|nr:hypothetical protein THF1C08_260057 [Vibrio jasicida]CAH1596695.1 hypothetical protein THF1A12_300041 [Vibrio jasicida]CAH1605754.1 hypothetical protein THF5G08_170052 [Vibrio jasicida]